MLEIDMVVADAPAAFELYSQTFGAQLVEDKKSTAEVVFELQSSQFHLFNENQEIGWFSPQKNAAQSFWFNLIVENSEKYFNHSVDAGFEVVVPLTLDEELAVKNGVVRDKFGYSWVIEEILHPISFEKRCEILAERFAKGGTRL